MSLRSTRRATVRSGEIVFSLSLESFAGASDDAAALVPLAQQLVARL